jgi:hypothetical protein
MIDGDVEVLEIDALPTEAGKAAPPDRWRHDKDGHEDE